MASAVRMLYALHSPTYITTGDSVSYFLTAKQIVEKKQFVDPWRTPIYPMILSIPYVITHATLPDEISGIYTFGLYSVRIVQSLAVVIASVFLYLICTQIGIKKSVAALLVLLGTCDYVLLLLEHAILTEAFAFCWLVFVVYIQIQLLRKFSIVSVGILLASWIVGVFLRPSFIAIPILCISLLILRYRTWNVARYALLSLCIYASFLFGYSTINLQHHGVSGISRVSDVNIWGKLLHLDVQDSTLGQSDIAQKARSARVVNPKHPYEIFRQFPEMYKKEYAERFHAFVIGVLGQNRGAYIWDSLVSIPNVVTSKTDLIDITATTGVFDAQFAVLKTVYEWVMYLAYIPLFAFPFMIIYFVTKNTPEAYGRLMVLFISMYHVAMSTVMIYDDFGRHMSIARPFLLIAVYGVVQIVFSRLSHPRAKRSK